MASLDPYIALRAARLPRVRAGRRAADGGCRMRAVFCVRVAAVSRHFGRCCFADSRQHYRRSRRSHNRHIRACVRCRWPLCVGGAISARARNCCWCSDGKAEPLVAGLCGQRGRQCFVRREDGSLRGKEEPQAIRGRFGNWRSRIMRVRQVIAGTDDAVRPLLSARRADWSSRAAVRMAFNWIAADLDGKNELPLTYMPASAIPDDVLADGRILFEAGFPLGSGSTPELYLVYSDGSGVESYRCDHGPRAGVAINWLPATWSLRMDLAGAFHVATCARGAHRRSARRLRGRHRRNAFWRMARERADHGCGDYAAETVAARTLLLQKAATGYDTQCWRWQARTSSSRSCLLRAAAQAASFSTARLELRQSARSRCAPVARWRL